MTDTLKTRTLGQTAENKACDHLQKNGLKLIERNFYCPLGEIDLIMKDGEDMVFVEVRSKKNLDDALESIDQYKQAKLIKTATYYLQKKKLIDNIGCRFDVVALNDTQIEWIQNAFYADNF